MARQQHSHFVETNQLGSCVVQSRLREYTQVMPNDKKSTFAEYAERGYDKVAAEYAELEGAAKWPRMSWLAMLLDLLRPASAVLDLGCGSGDPADVEIAKNHTITGVDVSSVQIELAKKNVPSGSFIHGDLEYVSFDAGSFDAVVMFYAIEHVPRLRHRPLLEKIRGWIRPGGYLLFTTEAADYDEVSGEWLGVPMVLSCFEPETTKQIVRDSGFDIVETAVESQLEGVVEIPYLWVLAQPAADI